MSSLAVSHRLKIGKVTWMTWPQMNGVKILRYANMSTRDGLLLSECLIFIRKQPSVYSVGNLQKHGCNFVYFWGLMWDPNVNIWDPNCHFGTPIVEAPETHQLLYKWRSVVHIEGSLYQKEAPWTNRRPCWTNWRPPGQIGGTWINSRPLGQIGGPLNK